LIGIDAVNWLRSRMDVFDPIGLIGVLGLHVFLVAPLLHVTTGYWMGYVTAPDDWRPWLGYMAWVNVAGLTIYLATRRFLTEVFPVRRARLLLQIEPRRFVPWLGLALVGTALLQAVVYVRFGGVSGFINAYGDSAEHFVGFGLIFMFSESFPILAVIGASYWAQQKPQRRNMTTVIVVLIAFVMLKFVFGGLRGSRGHLIYGLFWAAGIVHLMIRPLPKKLFAVGGIFLVFFMYAYGFYKSFGADSVLALRGSQARAELLESSPRTLDAVVLGDLARSDVQAFELYRLSMDWSETRYDYAWGGTYLGAAALLIPRFILPDRPPTKIKAGTDLLFGPGVFENEMIGTNAYGLVGEAMLNFGLIGGLLSFTVLAAVVVWARRWLLSLSILDSRRYIVPFLLSLTFMVLIWDSDVVLFYTIKEGLFPSLFIAISSRFVRPSTPTITTGVASS
jgi:hypothetical protein